MDLPKGKDRPERPGPIHSVEFPCPCGGGDLVFNLKKKNPGVFNVHMLVPWHVEAQGHPCMSNFSSDTVLAPEVQFKSSGLVASTFTYGISHWLGLGFLCLFVYL